MCLAVPCKVVSINDNKAVVEVFGVTRNVAIDLISDVEVGDYLIVHAGCAIEKIDEEEAKKTLTLFEEIEGIGK